MSSRSQAKKRAALVSVTSNSILTCAKFIAAFLSGSMSLLSEAVHSFSDVVASLVAFIGVHVSDAPADEGHPFGHGKAEPLAGFVEALLLFAAAIYIGLEAMNRFTRPEPIKVDIAIIVVTATALVNVFVGKFLHRTARETESDALHADSAHILADSVTSTGVLCALLLVRFTRNQAFDGIVAILLALWIIFSAIRIAFRSLDALMDVQLPGEEMEAIREILRTHPEVKDWHQLRTRKAGSHRHIDAHILLGDDLSLVRAHEITEEVEDRIRARLPNVSVSLHMEPYANEIKHRRQEHPLSSQK